MTTSRASLLSVLLALAVPSAALLACTSTSTGTSDGPKKVADEDERTSVGVPPSADGYCTQLGFTLDGESNCVFPDGTRCEAWSFYRGTCGQAHSYCNQHGGTIREVTADAGTWTEIYGACTKDGIECMEGHFVATGRCE